MPWTPTPRSRGRPHQAHGIKDGADHANSANVGFDDNQDNDRRLNGILDVSGYIVDIREYDVPYYVRVFIDKGKFRVLQFRLAAYHLQISVLGDGTKSRQSMALAVLHT